MKSSRALGRLSSRGTLSLERSTNPDRPSLIGCWRLEGETIFVFWDDGDTYSYPLDALRMTDEWLRYLEQQRAEEPTT